MQVKGYMGRVSFYGSTVIVAKRLRGENRIPVASIASVETGPAGPGMRFIRFATAASGARTTAPLGSHTKMAQDPNALTYQSRRQPEFEALAAAVEAAIHGPATAGGPPPGWYPDSTGMTRWWDGATWGPVHQG